MDSTPSGLGFGLAFMLRDQFTPVSRNIRNEFGRLSGQTKAFSNNIENSLSSVYDGMAKVGSGVALMLPLYEAVKAYSQMDSLERGLTAIMQSSEAMQGELIKLNEVAKLPGLGFKEAVQGSINLQAAGLSADLARRALMGFGNALATVGRGKAYLDGVNLALSQIMSKGKVQAQEINQIAERVPQIRKIMQAAFGTSNTEVLGKMNMSAQKFVEGVVAQLEKLPKVTGGIGNAFENVSDSWFKLLAAIGKNVPLVETVLNKLSDLFSDFANFVKTPIGGFVIQAVTLFTTIASGSLIMGGLKKILPAVMGNFNMLGGVLSSIGGVGKSFLGVFTSIGSKIFSFISLLRAPLGGLAARVVMVNGFRSIFVGLGTSIMSVGRSILAFFVSNPVGVIIGGITLAVYGLYKAWQSFSDVMSGNAKASDGSLGVLQKIGGVLHGISQIFSTLDSNGVWSMSQQMENSLRDIGVLDTVIALGTWIVRIREIFYGFFDAIGAAFSSVKAIFSETGDILGSIFGSAFSGQINKLLTSMTTFRNIGSAIGWVFGFVFKALAIGFSAIVIAVSVVVKVVLAAIGLVKNIIVGVYDFFANLIPMALSAGTAIVSSISQGVKQAWEGITTWLKNAWDNTVAWFSKPIEMVKGWWNGEDSTNGSQGVINQYQDGTLSEASQNRAIMSTAPAAAMYSMQPTIIDKSTQTVRTVENVIQLDGRDIYRSTNDYATMYDAMTGG